MTKLTTSAALATVLCGLLVLVAAAAPAKRYDFRLEDVGTGDTVSFSELSAERPLVVHVWSPECPHCQRHMPYFSAFVKKADPELVNIYTIAVDDADEAIEYLEDKGLSVPVLDGESGKLSDSFEAKGWPTTFVFAAGGNYVGYSDASGSSYISAMLELVDEAAAE